MANLLSVQTSLRNARRYAEIIRVLGRYGLGDAVQTFGLDKMLEKGMSLVGQAERAPDFEHLPRPVRLRRAMEELGPTFIKLGQVLSTRPDLVPREWADEFKNLQADCPRVPIDQIRARLEEEFPEGTDRIFRSFEDEPLAAGSMAQAHRAVLRDGTRVVVKILRPGIHDVTRADMDILRSVATIVEERFPNIGFSPTDVVREFSRELNKETDLSLEGQSTDQLRSAFGEDEGVGFPVVFWQATTKNVLTVEEVQGVLLSSMRPGDLTDEERRAVVRNGARAVFRMCLEMGFFHADPHPGNIFALPGGRVCFIDCGMTGRLEGRTRQALADLVAAVAAGDAERVSAVVMNLTDAPLEKREDRHFNADVSDFVARFQGATMERMDMGAMLQDFFDRLRSHHIKCPGDLVLLIKAMTTIQAVAADLDPGFDMVGFARPYIERLVKQRYGPKALRRRATGALREFLALAEELPADLRSLVDQSAATASPSTSSTAASPASTRPSSTPAGTSPFPSSSRRSSWAPPSSCSPTAHPASSASPPSASPASSPPRS